jgi:hypothetical protein
LKLTTTTGAGAAAWARHSELGAPLRRELAGRAVRARPGDQRLRRAAGEPLARLQAAAGGARAGARQPCPPLSLRRPWRAIWRARCRCWPATRRMAWRPPWRGSGGRSWRATREFPRSAQDAEKHALELDPIRNSRPRLADRRKEDALNKRRRTELVPIARGQTDDVLAALWAMPLRMGPVRDLSFPHADDEKVSFVLTA